MCVEDDAQYSGQFLADLTGVSSTLKAILFWTEKALQPIWPVDMLPERKASCMEKTEALCRTDVCGRW